MFIKKKWNSSQQAELDFWEQGEKVYKHFSKEYWEKELKSYSGRVGMKDFEDKKILEIGCGPKGMIHYIPGKEKIGIDPLIKEYEKFNILEGGGVKHYVGVGEKLTFADESFDIIICFNVLDHSRVPEKVCEEMFRVLKKKGNIIFHSHCIVSWLRPFRSLLSFFDSPHPWHFTQREVEKMFLNVGFKEVFVNVNMFHWRAKNHLKNLIVKNIIKNYFAIFEKA